MENEQDLPQDAPKARLSPTRRGYGRKWEKIRKAQLQRSAVCAVCGGVATEVDHIIPIAQGGDYTISNLQSICRPCHSRKTVLEDGGLGRDAMTKQKDEGDMTVERANGKRVKDFRPASQNANRHTARGMGLLEQSVRRDGWIGAMTTAADGEMIAGSARLEKAAEVFGVDAEPIVIESDGTRPIVVVRKDIPDAQDERAQRLGLADNRIAALDLAFDVEVIAAMSVDVLGDLWTPAELSDLGQAWANEQEDEKRAAQQDAGAQVDKAAELQAKWQTASGQLWQLGEHRLICGDCTDKATVERVMQGERAVLLVTSPPYGVGKEYETGGVAEWRELINKSFDVAAQVSPLWFVNLGDRKTGNEGYEVHTFGLMVSDFEAMGYKLLSLRVWAKDAAWAGQNPYWRQTYKAVDDFEFVGLFAAEKPKHKARLTDDENKEWGYRGVWNVASVHANDIHSAGYPLEIPCRAVRLLTDEGAIVYEPFSGSGTTIIACEKLGRKCRAVEISPAYVAVALERYFKTTGKTPVLVDDNART